MDNKLTSFLSRVFRIPMDSDLHNTISNDESELEIGTRFIARLVRLDDGICKLEIDFEFPEDQLESIANEQDLVNEILASEDD